MTTTTTTAAKAAKPSAKAKPAAKAKEAARKNGPKGRNCAPAAPAAPKAAKPLSARAAIEADAAAGKLPPAPNFEAATHARFRGKLAAVIALAEAGDLQGLRAYAIKPISSSPKAIARYRDLAITALTAKAGEPK